MEGLETLDRDGTPPGVQNGSQAESRTGDDFSRGESHDLEKETSSHQNVQDSEAGKEVVEVEAAEEVTLTDEIAVSRARDCRRSPRTLDVGIGQEVEVRASR